MKKKSTKVLSGALATTTVLGSVMGATPAMAANNVDQLFNVAYTATEVAKTAKTQEKINEARKALRELNEALKNDPKLQANLIGTLSSQLDPLQQAKFVEFYNIIYKEDKVTKKDSLTQTEINNARKYVEDFKGAYVVGTDEYNKYIGSWSSAVDEFQDANIVKVTTAVKKAQTSKLEADVKEARKLLNELLTVTNNNTVKEFAQGLDIQLSKVEKELEEEAKKAKVSSVSAINASELVVKFNKAIDASTAKDYSNYELKVNNTKVILNDANFQMGSTDKEVIIRLANLKEFKKGDRYVVQTNDAIKTTSGAKFEKFVSDENTFNESEAPKLLTVNPVNNEKLALKFDRPIVKSFTMIKDNGVSLTVPENGITNSGDAGDYVYYVTASGSELAEKGKHDITIYDVTDTSKEYASKASVLTGSYTVTDATATAPKVIDAQAANANRFFLETNVEIDLTKAKLTVNKGNHEFTNGTDIKTDTDNNTKVYYEKGVNADGKPGIWVVVTDDKDGSNENPLYKDSETTATLTATLENYTASGLIGEKTTKTVKLNKNNTKPVIKNTTTVGNNLKVIFDNNLEISDALTNADVVVRDKDGVIKETSSVNLTDNTITVTLSTATADDAPYTVELKADKFKNKEVNNDIATYLVNTLNNDKITTAIKTTEGSNFKYKEMKLDATSGTGNVVIANNEITIKYGVDMDNSALKLDNYTIDGKALPKGTTIDFVGDKKTIRMTLPKESLSVSTKYRLTISTNIQTAAGEYLVESLQTKEAAHVDLGLIDNVAPTLKSAKYILADTTAPITSTTTTTNIEVTFSENLADITNDDPKILDDFKVLVNGSQIAIKGVKQDAIKKNVVTLTLGQDINVSQSANISLVPEVGTKVMNTTDVAGNKASIKVNINVPTLK